MIATTFPTITATPIRRRGRTTIKRNARRSRGADCRRLRSSARSCCVKLCPCLGRCASVELGGSAWCTISKAACSVSSFFVDQMLSNIHLNLFLFIVKILIFPQAQFVGIPPQALSGRFRSYRFPAHLVIYRFQ